LTHNKEKQEKEKKELRDNLNDMQPGFNIDIDEQIKNIYVDLGQAPKEEEQPLKAIKRQSS